MEGNNVKETLHGLLDEELLRCPPKSAIQIFNYLGPDTEKTIEDFNEDNVIQQKGLNNEKSKKVPREERVLSLTIDIPDGKKEILEVRTSDNIYKITEDFCIKHNLDKDCQQMLIDSIRQNLFDEPPVKNVNQPSPLERDNKRSACKDKTPARQIEEISNPLDTWKKEAEQRIRQTIKKLNQPEKYENNRRISEKRRGTPIPVHERLHQMVYKSKTKINIF